MSLFEIGRVCLKIAGRDAGRKCVVVESAGEGYVVVDGSTRRKKVNVKHLEPLSQMLDLKGKASHDVVKKAFEKLGLPVWDTKSKKPAARPKKQKVKKQAPVVQEKKTSKPKKAKKEVKAEEAVEAPMEA